MRVMRAGLITIGIIQILFGATLLVRPATLQTLLHVQPAAPAWVNYILAMSAARIIGYGVGMFVAAGAPWRHRVWINTMIAIQAVDCSRREMRSIEQHLSLGDKRRILVVRALRGGVVYRSSGDRRCCR